MLGNQRNTTEAGKVSSHTSSADDFLTQFPYCALSQVCLITDRIVTTCSTDRSLDI